jgi:hypothetical protein
MKLYKGKIPVIAQELVAKLVDDGDVELVPGMRSEAELDLQSIMNNYLRQERRLNNVVRDYIADYKIDYDRRGEIRREKAKELGHPIGDRVMPYLATQFNRMIMNSPNFDEVYVADNVIRSKIFDVLRSNNVNEAELRDEARARLSNLDENSLEYQIRYQEAISDVRRRRGLI